MPERGTPLAPQEAMERIMTNLGPQALRVLEALDWLERSLPCPPPPLPLHKIATGALGGDELLAEQVLKQLDGWECVRTETTGWRSGFLTLEGRRTVVRSAA